MKKRKTKRLLSFMLACLLVLNVPLPALGTEEIQMISAEQADETQAPETQTPETQAPETEALDAQAPDILVPEEILDAEEPDTDVLEMQISDAAEPGAEEPDAGIADTGALETPEEDADIPELEAPELQGTQETVPGMDEELVIADGDVPTEALPETEAPKILAPDLEMSDTETEAETAPEAALAGVQFALAEPGEDAGQEAYLASRQDEQDGNYIVTLPVTEEPIETIYVKPELTDPVCFAFAKAGENEAVELTDQAWTAVDIRALGVPAQEETAVILTVSATEDAEAEDATQYTVRFEQETAQPESGTETEEEPETEEATEANAEEAAETELIPDATEASSEVIEVPETEETTDMAETSDMEEAVSEDSDTEMWTEVDTETETEVMPEEVLEAETEAMDAADAGESESGSESESGNESESETKPEMKPTSVELAFSSNPAEEEIRKPVYDEANRTYTFTIPEDKVDNITARAKDLIYLKIVYPESYYGRSKIPGEIGSSPLSNGEWVNYKDKNDIDILGDMANAEPMQIQIGTSKNSWYNVLDEDKALQYKIIIQSGKLYSARPILKRNGDESVRYLLNAESVKPLSAEVTSPTTQDTLTYQWYEKKTAEGESEVRLDIIEGQTGLSYTPPVTTAGNYQYVLRVTNAEEGKESITADLSWDFSVIEMKLEAMEELPDSETVTLPWGKDNLAKTISAKIANPYKKMKEFTMTGKWYVAKESLSEEELSQIDAKGRELGAGTVTSYANTDYNEYKFTLPATTVLGTSYYYLKMELSCGEESVTKVFGPYALMIEAPSPLPYGVVTGEEPIGEVKISIADPMSKSNALKNAMGEKVEDIGPAGYFVGTSPASQSVPLYQTDDMMTVIARTCVGWGLTQTGAEENYLDRITRNSDQVSRGEFDRGAQSGWMGSLNDWITGRGFQEYSVAKGALQAGDRIVVQYTLDLGTDFGGGFDKALDYSLKALKVMSYSEYNSGWYDQLQPAFNKEVYEYDAIAYEATSTVPELMKVEATAFNKTLRVRVFVGEKEYRNGDEISVLPGDVLKIVCCDPLWDPNGTGAGNDALAKTYTVNIARTNAGLNGDSLLKFQRGGKPYQSNLQADTFAKSGNEPLATYVADYDLKSETGSKYSPRSIPYMAFILKIGNQSQLDEKNSDRVKIHILDLPEGTTGSIEPIDAPDEKQTFTTVENGLEVLLDKSFAAPGKWAYRIRLACGERKENYWVWIQKDAHGLGGMELDGSPSSFGNTVLNGQPEGTLFQLNPENEETGETGFSNAVYAYNLYATPGIAGIVPKTASGLKVGDISKGKTVLYVNGEEHVSGDTLSAMAQAWYANPVLITKEQTDLLIRWTNSQDESDVIEYEIHVIRKAYDVSDLEKLIRALPEPDVLEYVRDGSAVDACRATYDTLDAGQKAQLSADAVVKLEAAVAAIEKQRQTGEKKISDLTQLVEKYKDYVSKDTEVTQPLYDTYGADVIQSRRDYTALTGWVKDQFDSLHPEYGGVIEAAYKVINRYAIASGVSSEQATNYEDDFMVSSNAYNLTLGADKYAYPVTFRDVIYSGEKRSGESCLPYNEPGRLSWTIDDPEIVDIEKKEDTYEDKGLGGSGEFADEKYYLIPKKAGTTFLTVTLANEAGVYYGQIPKIIIHVNSPEEASIEGLSKKLSDFEDLQYVTKYDTWHYIAGTEGAPFTFHVYGEEPQVTVWPTGSSGEKKTYPVAEDGSVTVYIKDGYNPIEVSAVLEGKRVTQVYGLRGKAINVSVENKYRNGEPFVQGDTAVIKLTGLNTPVHKILRIYNPWGGVIWTYETSDLPGQGNLRAETDASQYGTGYLEVLLTGYGTVTLKNGHIEEGWMGSGLYSEADQGNTGGIASQTSNNFSRLPDIVLQVAKNDSYQQNFRIQTGLDKEGIVKSGDTVTVKLLNLPLMEIAEQYPFVTSSTTTKFVSAQTMFNTTIPGLSQIKSELIENPKTDISVEGILRGLQDITFTVPEDTLTGTYRICGGYVDVRHGDANWTIDSDKMFRIQIADLDIQVINPKPGQHTCDWGEGKVTKEATCTEDGVRTYTCSICGETKTEVIPSRGGHKYDDGKEVQPATCVKAGIRMYTCSACGQTKTEQIPAMGKHSFDEGKETQAPTCGQKGVRTYTCKICGETKTEDIPATGEHDFVWKTVKKATVFDAKKQKGTCTVCGETEERTAGKKLKPTIKLNVSKIVLKEKQSTTALEVSGLANGDSVVSYKSGNKKIFKVSDSGKITAGSKKGEAKLTITLASGKKKTVTVVVQKTAVKTTKISGLDKKMTIKKGKKATLKPQLTPVTSKQKITYKSSNKKVATVTGKGVIKAKKKGKATITVQSGNVKFKVKVTVK